MELVHNDCEDAIKILKSMLEEDVMKMKDGMIVHEEAVSARVAVVEQEQESDLEQIQVHIDRSVDQLRENTS